MVYIHTSSKFKHNLKYEDYHLCVLPLDGSYQLPILQSGRPYRIW